MNQVYDCEKLTDMEVALSLLRLMDDLNPMKKNQKPSGVKGTYCRIVENAVETFTNPFAKNLLRAKLAEQGQY